ncbi:MAG: hypothetical protein VW270_28030, partial [Candidatus Poseidoniales archaeon]
MNQFVQNTIICITVSLLLTSCALIGLEEEEETTAASTTSTSTPSSSTPTIQTTVDAVAGSAAIETNATVSVVAPKSSSSSSARSSMRVLGGPVAAIDVNSFSASSDYAKDATSIFVYEEAAQALQNVNGILCQIGQSRPDLMLNEGPYKAQVDENKCKDGGNDSRGGSGAE